ncbi:hypothetical protein pb186bvf_019553 [Paramecium bursaria]
MAEQSQFLQQQQQEINDIYEEFKSTETGLLDVGEFIEILRTTNMDRNCDLLIKKLELHRGKQINREEFTQLFDFDYQRKENFDLMFSLLDSSKSGKITKDELKRQSELWGLQLNDRDLDIMIKWCGDQQVTKDSLWLLMQNQYQQ